MLQNGKKILFLKPACYLFALVQHLAYESGLKLFRGRHFGVRLFKIELEELATSNYG